jgi:hypothetical protein
MEGPAVRPVVKADPYRRQVERTIHQGAPKDRVWVVDVTRADGRGDYGDTSYYLVRSHSEGTARTKACRLLGIKWRGHSIGCHVADGPTGLEHVDVATPLGERAEERAS